MVITAQISGTPTPQTLVQGNSVYLISDGESSENGVQGKYSGEEEGRQMSNLA